MGQPNDGKSRSTFFVCAFIDAGIGGKQNRASGAGDRYCRHASKQNTFSFGFEELRVPEVLNPASPSLSLSSLSPLPARRGD